MKSKKPRNPPGQTSFARKAQALEFNSPTSALGMTTQSSNPSGMNVKPANPPHRTRNQVQCKICHKTGHAEESCFSCPKNGEENKRRANQLRKNRLNNAHPCILCGSSQHLSASCPSYPNQSFTQMICPVCVKYGFHLYHNESVCLYKKLEVASPESLN